MEELDARLTGKDIGENFSFEELVVRFKWQLILLLLGVSLIGGGFWFYKSQLASEPVEVIQEESKSGEIVVQIEGEVENPGVVRLSQGARVEDAIQAAGGIKKTADWEWVKRNLNRAAKLTDGAKIYIPKLGENVKGSTSNTGSTSITGDGFVNINSATQAELEALWGIGPVTAKKIIEGRPYSGVEELVTRKILKQNVYEANKDKLTVY